MVSSKRMAWLNCVVFLVFMLGQGCTVIWNSEQSVLQPLSQFPSIDPSTLVADSVVIKVAPENSKVFGFVGPVLPIIPVWHSEGSNRFWFLISLFSQNGEITFDPRRVALETEQGDIYVAMGFSGPLGLAELVRNKSDPHKKLLDEKVLNVSASPFAISTEVLIGVMFEIETIDPEQHFTLVLKGLEREGHSIEVPPLKFSKERRRHLDFLLFDPLNFHAERVIE